jgi:hypothetical protein
MASGDDDRRVWRKFDAPKEKPLSRHDRGVASSSRGVVGSSGVARDRGVMMSRFGKRRLWRELDVSSLLMLVQRHHLI